MSWVAVAVAVGSQVAKGVSEHKQGAAKGRLLEQGYKSAEESRAQASETINGLLGKLGASNPAQYENASKQQFMDQILGNTGRINASIPGVSGGSSRYAHDVTGAQTGARDFATRLSGLMAKIGAPQQQRQQESFDATRTGSKLAQIEDFARGNAGVTGIKIDDVHPSPWLGLLTNAAGAFAGGYSPGNGLSDSANHSIWTNTRDPGYIPQGPAVSAFGE